MRKAAGIILIALGAVLVVAMIIDVIDFDFPSGRLSMLLGTLPWTIVFGGFLVAGGVYCLKRRYWGLCLVSAVVPLSLWIAPLVVWLVSVLVDGLVESGLSSLWPIWIQVPGALIATIFISRRKKEWQGIED